MATRPTSPTGSRDTDAHHRIRHDRVDTDGKLTLRHNGQLHHTPISTASAEPTPEPLLMLIHYLHTRAINAATGELLRELTLDPTRNYQPTGRPPGPPNKKLPNPR